MALLSSLSQAIAFIRLKLYVLYLIINDVFSLFPFLVFVLVS